MADALGRGFGAARPVVRGGTADARTRVRTRVGACLRGAMGVGTAARRGGSVHVNEYMYIYIYIYMYMCVCVCLLHAYIYVHYSLHLYM